MINHTDIEKAREESINNDSKTIDETLTTTLVGAEYALNQYKFVHIRSD